jgi:hypothetical protein
VDTKAQGIASNPTNPTPELSDRQKRMIAAMEKTMGIVAHAAPIAKISRDTHYAWLEKYPEYRRKIEEIENLALDTAESELLELIKERNPQAIMFYLKTKGKKRGYTENPTTAIQVNNSIENKGMIWELARAYEEVTMKKEAKPNVQPNP